MKGFKVFDKDFKCGGFQYEVGKTYEMPEEEVKNCKIGFIFFYNLADCFLNYYSFDLSKKVAVIEAGGKIICEGGKSYCSVISIVRVLTWNDVLAMVLTSRNHNLGCNNIGSMNNGDHNRGDYNIGDKNSGNKNIGCGNSGDHNIGYSNSGCSNIGETNTGNENIGSWNTGNENIGSWNTGNKNIGSCNLGNGNIGCWNSGNGNKGYFNTGDYCIRMFNRQTNIKEIWLTTFPIFFGSINPVHFVSSYEMTDEEKKEHPDYLITGGYLKEIDYKEAWIKAFNKAKSDINWKKEKKRLLAIPNFDYDIFEEITGITKEMIEEDNNK